MKKWKIIPVLKPKIKIKDSDNSLEVKWRISGTSVDVVKEL